MYYELFTRVKHLLTNRLQVNQLNIAINSLNNSVTATKYIEYGTRYPFYHARVGVQLMNRRIVYACNHKRLLTNLLHGKAAILELANS